MRPIDAEPFRQALLLAKGFLDEDTLMTVVNTLDTEPTIDPEELRPKGEWIMTLYTTTSERGRVTSNKKFACSDCGYGNGRKQTNYCPNCGAKMATEVDGDA